jgi:hypothetical protein
MISEQNDLVIFHSRVAEEFIGKNSFMYKEP